MGRVDPQRPVTADCKVLATAASGRPRTHHVIIDAEAEPANPGGWPRGGTTRLDIANRHLEYALTWYGLAATLIGVFAAFAAGRLRAAGQA